MPKNTEETFSHQNSSPYSTNSSRLPMNNLNFEFFKGGSLKGVLNTKKEAKSIQKLYLSKVYIIWASIQRAIRSLFNIIKPIYHQNTEKTIYNLELAAKEACPELFLILGDLKRDQALFIQRIKDEEVHDVIMNLLNYKSRIDKYSS